MPQTLDRYRLLRKSFVHLPGVGARKEAALWAKGITTWSDLLAVAPKHFRGKRLAEVQASLEESLGRWEAGDLAHFSRALPPSQRWRLIEGAYPEVSYLDIEATGGYPPRGSSTVIGFLHQGVVLQEHDFRKKRDLIERILAETSLVCSYNGGSFDLPFLSAEFGIDFDVPHVDLCPWLRRHGFTGGLKAIQKSQIHLHQRASADINGSDAERLWRLHEQGVPGALRTLLTYNAEDVLILPGLLVDAYHREADAMPEEDLARLTEPDLPSLETSVDWRVYELLKARTTAEVSDPIRFLKL